MKKIHVDVMVNNVLLLYDTTIVVNQIKKKMAIDLTNIIILIVNVIYSESIAVVWSDKI